MENELKYRQPLTHLTLHRHPKYPLGKYSSIGKAESKCFTMRKVILFVSRLQCLYQEILQGGHGTGKTGNLVLTFSRQGKHREFCSDKGKNLLTQGNIWTVIINIKSIYA